MNAYKKVGPHAFAARFSAFRLEATLVPRISSGEFLDNLTSKLGLAASSSAVRQSYLICNILLV